MFVVVVAVVGAELYSFCAVRVAVLVMVVWWVVSMTFTFSLAILPLARLPIFHIPVWLL